MKFNIKHSIFSLLAAVAFLGATSCTDDFPENYDDNSEEVTVKFTVAPEASSITKKLSRGEESTEPFVPHISDGSKVDVLIYAVYEVTTDAQGAERIRLLTEYGKGSSVEGFEAGEGQTIIWVNSFPTTLELKLRRGKNYRIAFWAQSHYARKSYVTTDLRKVEMVYSSDEDTEENSSAPGTESSSMKERRHNLNNDEYRDAFCKFEDIQAGVSGSIQRNIYLYRPLAQINIGTNGYDYEIVTRNAIKKYRYSKIRINRVARYLDVVVDKIYHSTTGDNPYDGEKDREAYSVVDYDFAPIPAYTNYQDPEYDSENFPPYPSYSMWDWAYHKNGDFIPPHPDMRLSDYDKEEFLKVRLSDKSREGKNWIEDQDLVDGIYHPYANYSNYNDKDSETFKYLSMCYVLTSSTETEGVVINNIKAWLATDADGTDAFEIVNLNQVPAQRNWRTNIVGNLLTEENTFDIYLDKDFAGEYNGWRNDTWEWSGPLAKGVYYDAEKDEIQISDADGLIWFRRMVNGKMRVRWSTNSNNTVKPTVGNYYRYYDESDNLVEFREDGISPQDCVDNQGKMDVDLVKRIIKATHQDERSDYNANNNYGWPANNNFHFTGATVKLMADIDLTGIEWVPIGFDFKVAEWNYNSNNSNSSEMYQENFKDSTAKNRGFYGKFDGNNHSISNLKTKRFSASVDEDYIEQVVGSTAINPRNFDAIPWFGRGLFGNIGGNAIVRNVRLFNVDIKGCQGVGGVVGVAYGDAIEIENCMVDGGTLLATPMYRNDRTAYRSFARGTYLGGIVGYFNTNGGTIKGCEVRNLTIKGYRQVGGLVGTLDIKYSNTINGHSSQGKENTTSRRPGTCSGNSIKNTVILCSQLHFPFGFAPSTQTLTTEVGFGWTKSEFDLYSGKILGGDYNEFLKSSLSYFPGTDTLNVTFAEMTETRVDYDAAGNDVSNSTDAVIDHSIRNTTIADAPLKLMPALSSWFTDNIDLKGNYYGEPSANRLYKVSQFTKIVNNITPKITPYYPMNLPYDVEIAWDKTSANVGLYVESVSLNGAQAIGGRSVITPVNVSEPGSCCMYVTARDRKGTPSVYSNNYARPTTIQNVVLRGQPFAYTGLLISPNENMSDVTLKNVAIYDVYQTIALDDCSDLTKSNHWPRKDAFCSYSATLTLDDCNLRGYTLPGPGFKTITYKNTTFEAGANTVVGTPEERYTCIVYSNTLNDENGVSHGIQQTTFENCIFKAPYIIDLSTANLDYVTFTNCVAASSSTTNRDFDPARIAKGCKKIVIGSNAQGRPTISYLDASGNEIE